MKKQKTLKGFLMLTAGIILFSSCNKNDTNPTFQVKPDVITMVKQVNDTLEYAPAFYAYANIKIESAEVTTPGGSTIGLSSFNSDVITYAKLPAETDYTETQPQSGEYSFSVKSTNGDEFTGSDILYHTDLETPVITGTSFDSSQSTVHVTWDPVLSSNGYFVRLLDQNGGTVYTGYNVSADSTGYTIRMSDKGWVQSPNTNTKYTLEMDAVEYDSDDNLTEYYYHVNAIASSNKEIIWKL